MQYYKREFPTSDINVYPFGDCHIGSPQYCHPLAKLVVNTVKNDDRGYMVLMGDLIENAIVGSLGDVYTQTMPPAEQLEFVVDLLEPVKEKILFMIRGNHEFRTFKTVGMFPEQYLSAKLGLVPFLGTSVYAMFLLESHTPKSFKCYFHHGSGGGSTQGGKVNRLRSLREIAPDADATFMGHVHTTGRVAHTWKDVTHKGIVDRVGYDYLTGSALTWSESYAEAKLYPPSACEFISVNLRGATTGKRDNRQQTYSIIKDE